MIENKLNAMPVATTIMGISTVLMAWCLALVAVHEWAVRREVVTRLSVKRLR